MMNLYTIKLKAQQVKQATEDFYKLENRYPDNVSATKIFFYFIIDNGKKYIHKESLRLVYTNGDTYSYDENTPNYCAIDCKKFKPEFDAFLNNHMLLSSIEDKGDFYYMDYINGDPITEISRDEFFYLKKHRNFNGYTPFYNSMCYNIVRTSNGTLKLIDLKHFEKIDDKEFFIYMYNKKANVNILYVEDNIHNDRLNHIIAHLERDYNVIETIRYK